MNLYQFLLSRSKSENDAKSGGDQSSQSDKGSDDEAKSDGERKSESEHKSDVSEEEYKPKKKAPKSTPKVSCHPRFLAIFFIDLSDSDKQELV